MTTLITYLGKPDLKVAFLGEIGKHELADQITKGTYGEMNGQWHGCAIGCSLRSLNLLQGKQHDLDTSQHHRMPSELGWPLWLAYLEDNLFENLPYELAKTWPRRLAEAIPVGVTVPDLVLAKLLRWVLIHERFGAVHAAGAKSTKNIVRTMGALFDRTIAGEIVPEAEWNEAARAAWAAWAARAAWAAWDARAGWAARAAWAAGTRDAFYPALSEEVLRLLRELDPSASTEDTEVRDGNGRRAS
jgi:hypothetical protein